MKLQECTKGVLVQLKSGSPVMTCQGNNMDIPVCDTRKGVQRGMVRCQWFAGKKSCSDWFLPESLRIASAESKSKKR